MQKSKSDRFTPTQMFCKEVKPQLSSYLDQELPKLEMGAVGCHLRNCSDCAFEMMQMRQVHSVLQRAQPVSASSTFLPLMLLIISVLLRSSSPSNFIEPLVIIPGLSIKFIIALATVDLPDPDSPTIPIISPLWRLNEIFLLA